MQREEKKAAGSDGRYGSYVIFGHRSTVFILMFSHICIPFEFIQYTAVRSVKGKHGDLSDNNDQRAITIAVCDVCRWHFSCSSLHIIRCANKGVRNSFQCSSKKNSKFLLLNKLFRFANYQFGYTPRVYKMHIALICLPCTVQNDRNRRSHVFVCFADLKKIRW